MNEEKKHTESGPADTSAVTEFRPLPWIAAALFALGLAAIAGFYWSSVVSVQKVQFEGHHFVSAEELQAVDIPTGISPDSLNYMEIIGRIEAIPYVQQADIRVEPDGNLRISVSERTPLAMLADGPRKMFVDYDGLQLPVIHGKVADVPILYGFRTGAAGDTIRDKDFSAAADFLAAVQNRPVSNATISEIAWTDQNGIVALTNQNGVKLIFGKSDFDERLRNWEAFYGEIVREKGMEQMRSVDLRFRGQIVTREN